MDSNIKSLANELSKLLRAQLNSIYSIGSNFQVFFHFSGLDIYYVLQVQITGFLCLPHDLNQNSPLT
jgi:hypothetical protein